MKDENIRNHKELSKSFDMSFKLQEKYVFYHFALIDMERAQHSLDYLDNEKDEYLRDVLFRDAVICYAKPFLGSKGLKENRWNISSKGIPKESQKEHKEIIKLRNQLFAHGDLDRQRPKFNVIESEEEKHFSFSVEGYEKIDYADHLVDPMKTLTKVMHANIINECFSIKEKIAQILLENNTVR